MDGLGIATYKKERKPVFKIYRFLVYDAGSYQLLEPSARKRNINYQIESPDNTQEKLVVRLFKNEEGLFQKARMYSLPGMDAELSWLLTNALIEKIKETSIFSDNFELKVIEQK